MRVKCTAKDPQHFTGIETFHPDEVRDVPEEQAEMLLRSPFIERAEPTKSEQRRTKAVRGTESE